MRFSMRDLLWAMLVVAMGLGWWLSYVSIFDDYALRYAQLEKRCLQLDGDCFRYAEKIQLLEVMLNLERAKMEAMSRQGAAKP